MPKSSAYDLHRAEMRALVTMTSAGGSLQADEAALNLTNRQPAFWTSAGYSNSVAGTLLDYANRCGGVCKGIVAHRIDFGPGARDIDEETTLDTLVPLNEAGIASLQEAYEQRCGTFRSRAELLERQRDIGFRAADECAAYTSRVEAA